MPKFKFTKASPVSLARLAMAKGLQPREKITIIIAFSISLLFFGVFIITSNIAQKEKFLPINTDNIIRDEYKSQIQQILPEVSITTNFVKEKIVNQNYNQKDSEIEKEIEEINKKSASILVGEIKLDLEFTPGELLYDVLIKAKNEGQIIFEGKNYPGLGFFVTDIGILHSGNGKNLLYYVNGEMATVGVSVYALKENDEIEWKLE